MPSVLNLESPTPGCCNKSQFPYDLAAEHRDFDFPGQRFSVAFFDSDDVISQLLSMSDFPNPTPGRSLQLIDN